MEMMARVAVIGRLGWGWRICSQFTQVAPGQGSCRRRECPHERAAGFPGASALGVATEKCGTFPRQLPEVTRQHFCFIPFTGGESRRPAHTPGKASPHSGEGRNIRDRHVQQHGNYHKPPRLFCA